MSEAAPAFFLFTYKPEQRQPYAFHIGHATYGFHSTACICRTKTLNTAIRYLKKLYVMYKIPDDFYTELKTAFMATKLSLKAPEGMELKYITDTILTEYWIGFSIKIPR